MAKLSLKPKRGSREKPATDQGAVAPTATAEAARTPTPAEKKAAFDPTMDDRAQTAPEQPRLVMINRQGAAGLAHPAKMGHYLFDGRVVIDAPAEIIPYKVAKYFVTARVNGVDLTHTDPKKRYNTLAEAQAEGFVLDFRGKPANKVDEVGDLLAFVRGPNEDPTGSFPLKLSDGSLWSPTIMTFRRGPFREQLVQVIEAAILRNRPLGYEPWSLCFSMGSELKHWSKGASYEPRFKPLRRLKPEDTALLGNYVKQIGAL